MKKTTTKKVSFKECDAICKKVKEIFNDPADPCGCYTGTCCFGGKPEQDADDL